MKKTFYLIVAMLLLSFAYACSSDPTTEEPVVLEIKLSKESFLINKGGTTSPLSVDVQFPEQWDFTVSSSGKSWVTVKRPTNTNRLTITVSKTSIEAPRTTTISVFSKADRTISKSITIKQMGTKDGIVIDVTEHEVLPKDSLLTIELLANVEYDFSVDDNGKDWIEFVESKSSGDSEEQLIFSIAKNPKQKDRKGVIKFLSETKEEVKVTVDQSAGGIIASQKIYQAPSKQSTAFEVEIEAYAEISDIDIEEGKDWIEFLECVDAEEPYKKVLKFAIDKNPEKTEREIKVTIISEAEETTEFTLSQRGKDSVSNAESVGSDIVVKVDAISSSVTGSYLDTKPQNLIDGDLETYYSAAGTVNDMPVSLTCQFINAERLDYVDIVPGKVYGKWGEVDVYVTLEGQDETLYDSYDFNMSSSRQRVTFHDGLIKPRQVRFEIKTANMWVAGNGVDSPTLIAAHELIFYSRNPEAFDMLKFFTDDSYSALKPEVTEEMIETIDNEFFYNLASDLFSGDYDLKYRAAVYKPYPHPDVDAKKFRTSTYTLHDNVTGLYFEAGEHVVCVEETYGLPISIRVVDYQPDLAGNSNEDGHTYHLLKGVNKLNIERRGLIYVCYHTEDPKAKPVRINFPTAYVNKYYDLVNEPDVDWATMLAEAKADHIDMVGKQSIFTLPVEWIQYYCDTAEKAKTVIQQADSIIFLQEQIQGHHKYNTGGHRNRMLYSSTMASAFMFAGAYRTGYSLQYGKEGKNPLYKDGTVNMLLNPKKFRVDGWGAYHEVGHCNQLPGFKWTGMAEVTNNFTAMYCAHFFIGDNFPKHKSDYMLLMSGSWYDESGTLHSCSNRYDAAWQCFYDNGKKHAFSAYVGGDPDIEKRGIDPFFRIVPFWQLYLYNTLVMGRKDFYADVYHQCRVGNLPDGSPNLALSPAEEQARGGYNNDGERQMNFIRLCCDAAQEDLTEFFEMWGLMTPFEGVINDYGAHKFRVTQAMIDEVYDYAKKYPKPTKKNIWFINNYNLDKYRNGDGSDVTGFNIPADIDECDGRYVGLYNGM